MLTDAHRGWRNFHLSLVVKNSKEMIENTDSNEKSVEKCSVEKFPSQLIDVGVTVGRNFRWKLRDISQEPLLVSGIDLT